MQKVVHVQLNHTHFGLFYNREQRGGFNRKKYRRNLKILHVIKTNKVSGKCRKMQAGGGGNQKTKVQKSATYTSEQKCFWGCDVNKNVQQRRRSERRTDGREQEREGGKEDGMLPNHL